MEIVAMPLFVSMHFRFKLDIDGNFTMQNGEWVFIKAFFQLSRSLVLTQRLSLFIYYYIMLSDCATHFLKDTKK